MVVAITIDELADGSLVIYDGAPPDESVHSYGQGEFVSEETGETFLIYSVRGITEIEAYTLGFMWSSKKEEYDQYE